MQMHELESTAWETPGPAASRGPGPCRGRWRGSAPRAHAAWHCRRGAQPHAAAGKRWKWKLSGEENNKKTHRFTPGEQAVPHHVRTKNKPAFSPGFAHQPYDDGASLLCAGLTVSGPRRTLALLSRRFVPLHFQDGKQLSKPGILNPAQQQSGSTAPSRYQSSSRGGCPHPEQRQDTALRQTPSQVPSRLKSSQQCPLNQQSISRSCFSPRSQVPPSRAAFPPLTAWSHLTFYAPDGC